ncbi:MAG TPA: DUF3558 domain-containing protein [Actinophytocola sp.]|jgi:hypothetical protein|uniref:DUF3558 domain-containing protein n=1 Tax=Actinophytocola sp. TaxID=1872138 RepID=UPI002E086A1C|nr:DUF3558 domain-containing protein [Actinophytocola sp.]
MIRWHHWLGFATLLALAACASDPPAQTTPTDTSRTNTSVNPSADAPPVKQPLDASRFLADPCQSLTASQRQTLTLAGGTSDPPHRACEFTNIDARAVAKISYSYGTAGLEEVYYLHSRGILGYWEPTALDGYPAILYESSPDKAKLSCDVAVGINDSSYFDVRYYFPASDPGGKNPCVEGRAVASAVLSTIKSAK